MKKINLKGLKEVLTEKELKEIMAGSGSSAREDACQNKKTGDSCSYTLQDYGSYSGTCQWVPFGSDKLFCYVGGL